jgi:transposase
MLTVWHSWWMPRAYALDLRERLLRARDAGMAPVAIERTLGISTRTQRRWAQRAAQEVLAPGTSPGRTPKIAPTQHTALRLQVVIHADATLAEHCARWAATTGVVVSTATMSRTLAKLGLSRKKRV